MKKILLIFPLMICLMGTCIYGLHYHDKHYYDDPNKPRPGLPMEVLQTTFLDVWIYKAKVKFMSDSQSMYRLGEYYLYTSDFIQSCHYYRMGAEQGDANSFHDYIEFCKSM